MPDLVLMLGPVECSLCASMRVSLAAAGRMHTWPGAAQVVGLPSRAGPEVMETNLDVSNIFGFTSSNLIVVRHPVWGRACRVQFPSSAANPKVIFLAPAYSRLRGSAADIASSASMSALC
jgi:hypothetical protein